jgi:hypothetical protein
MMDSVCKVRVPVMPMVGSTPTNASTPLVRDLPDGPLSSLSLNSATKRPSDLGEGLMKAEMPRSRQ